MKKFSSREISIFIITLGLFVIFIAYQFVVKPISEGAVDINDRLRVDQVRLMKARQMVARKAAIQSRYQNLVDTIGSVDSDGAQMPNIISKIEGAARESNIHIANIQPQESATQKEARFLGIELEIDGQWRDIVQFLYLLQQGPDLYFINELNLEKYSDTVNSLRGRIVISRMCLLN